MRTNKHVSIIDIIHNHDQSGHSEMHYSGKAVISVIVPSGDLLSTHIGITKGEKQQRRPLLLSSRSLRSSLSSQRIKNDRWRQAAKRTEVGEGCLQPTFPLRVGRSEGLGGARGQDGVATRKEGRSA